MGKIAAPRVLILILNWNGLGDTIECLDSINKIHYSNYSILVIDNGSDGNDVQALKAKFGARLNVIEIRKNRGFAGGINRGINYALDNFESEYMLLLNNDTIVAPDFLDKLIAAVKKDSTIGLAGPKILFYNERQYIQNTGNKIDMIKGSTISIDFKKKDIDEATGIQVTDYIDTAILVRNDLFKSVGLFDESYHCYWEDADYGARVSRAGFKIISVLDARIWHKKTVIPGPWYRVLIKGGLLKESPDSIHYLARNTFKFLKKYATKQQYRQGLAAFFHGIRDGLSLKS
ncbi:MAG: glycosyltransferase family 2 protein [Chloroflexi bacterium]|nr:glycosyltransferase family 2 protein [Chloroflexota bacterium]